MAYMVSYQYQNRKMRNLKTNTGYILFTAVMIFLFSACAKKTTFSVSPVVPAAEGSVIIKRDNNSNFTIDLNVKRLAEPERLTPPKVVYVVWMETDQSGLQNLGQLKTSRSTFSKMLTSSLKTTTPHQPTGFFISAEDDATVQYPGMMVVLRTGPLAK